MHKISQLIKSYRWPILSGFLVGTTYVPFPPWALLFAYAPLWVFVLNEQTDLKKTFWGSWMTQFTLTFIGFYWIYVTAKDFGGLPAPVAALALIAFCAFIHLYIPANAYLVKYLSQKFKLSFGVSLLLMALGHSIFERLWPSIFTWHLGYTLLWQNLPAYQWADAIGFFGLSTLILLFNALFAFCFRGSPKKVSDFLPALIAIFLFGVLNWTGSLRSKTLQTPDQKIEILAIQANIGNYDRMFAEKGVAGYQEAILDKFLEQTRATLPNFPKTELIAWPESAIPDYLDQNLLHRKNAKKLSDELLLHKIPLITGAFSKELSIADKDLSIFNGLFLMQQDPATGLLQSQAYRKTHLLAFGEYMPMSETFPILLKWLPFISNFGRGHGPMVLSLNRGSTTPALHLGGQICYEGLYHHFTIGLAQKGAQVLVNVTNDSWFGKHSEPEQHMIMTLARAIEVRRPLIRSTNTGITTAILANGEQLQRSPLHEVWAGSFSIPYLSNPPDTIYMRLNPYDLYFLIFLFFTITLIGGLGVRSQKP